MARPRSIRLAKALRWLRATTTVPILHRYLLKQFFNVLFLCLLAATTLFLVFDLFDRIGSFISDGSTVMQVISYMFFKIPMVLHLMMPVAILIATILSLGRLSQLSEITAMRACGASLLSLASPLLWVGLLLSFTMLLAGETIVPWATQRVEEIYHLDIRKKVEKGAFSRANFWYRSQRRFFNIGLYDAPEATLRGISIFELDDHFNLKRRTDAREAKWQGSAKIGWTMSDVIEISVDRKGGFHSSPLAKAPLVINEQPSDFYKMERRAESLSYFALRDYIEKLRSEGVSVTNYMVDLAAKLAFPFVNFIVVVIAIPFALIPARSGNLTMSFVAGVSIGFGYYIVHALSISLGKAELLPIVACAWTANVLLGSLGGYLLAGAESNEGLV